MAEPSPARLFATLAGVVLLAIGMIGFFNGTSIWLNLLHGLTGVAGLALAGIGPRRFAFWIGCAYVALAIWGFALGSGEEILGFLPVDTAGDFLHLAVGALGIGAALGTRRAPRPATA